MLSGATHLLQLLTQNHMGFLLLCMFDSYTQLSWMKYKLWLNKPHKSIGGIWDILENSRCNEWDWKM